MAEPMHSHAIDGTPGTDSCLGHVVLSSLPCLWRLLATPAQSCRVSAHGYTWLPSAAIYNLKWLLRAHLTHPPWPPRPCQCWSPKPPSAFPSALANAGERPEMPDKKVPREGSPPPSEGGAPPTLTESGGAGDCSMFPSSLSVPGDRPGVIAGVGVPSK